MAKGKGGNTVAVVWQLAQPVVEGLGYRLWDVRFEKEGPDYYLRVFIDKDGPMDTADCEVVSRALDPLLDEADPIEESYCFEVSSPGLGRRLTRPEHYAAMAGRECRVVLYHADENRQKEIVGTLEGLTDDGVALTDAGARWVIPEQEISYVKLTDDENLF